MKKKTKKAKKSVPKKPIARKTAKKSQIKRVRQGFDAVAATVAALFTSHPSDLISAIKRDHEGLRNFIWVMKDTDRPLTERRRAAELFSSLLKSHTLAEETAVYKPMEQKADHDLVIRIEEGYVEHTAADRVMADMEKATDPNVWSAHANVLAELVEHHLKEEEDEMFPMMKKQIPKRLEAELIVSFLDLRASTQEKVTEQNAGVLNLFQ